MQVGVIGTGYVGLQSAQALAKAGHHVIAYDIDKNRIQALQNEQDKYQDTLEFDIKNLTYTTDSSHLKDLDYYLICVPTPVDKAHKPCIDMVHQAAELIGRFLTTNSTVICESTVYPGVTEDIVLPILERTSQLKAGKDFHIGFSSERIDPGNTQHRFYNTVKVYAGLDEVSAQTIRALYETAIEVPLFEAKNIKTAEASKLLENIQRDVNIALMNEFTQVMDSIGISIGDVIDAAATKWNFVPYKPGFVGGHCIAVDPYYLTYLASEKNVNANLIKTARKINDDMLTFVEQKLLAFIEKTNHPKITLFGLTYKKNVSDFRNSLALNLYDRLSQHPLSLSAVEPFLMPEQKDINLVSINELPPQDLILVCVEHDSFNGVDFHNKLKEGGVLMDLPGMLRHLSEKTSSFRYWTP